MKRERLYYLDLIKIIAVICVFTCHFTRSVEYWQMNFTFKILPDTLFSLYTGAVGVTLFFIASGASLMYVYGDKEKLEVKKFYKKRFLGIYPMFWIAFAISFMVNFYVNGGYNHDLPKSRIIYSILGVDGNVAWYEETFYQVGEWFLSVIVMMYVLFPLLRILVNKAPLLTFILSTLITMIIAYNWNAVLPMDCLFINRVPELVFGMIFVKYIRKPNIFMFVPAVVVLIIMQIIQFPTMNTMVRILIVGISLFTSLAYIFFFVRGLIVEKLSDFISKYCYPVFLVHHSLMLIFLRHFWGKNCYAKDIVIIYIMTLILTIFVSKKLTQVTDKITGEIKSLICK